MPAKIRAVRMIAGAIRSCAAVVATDSNSSPFKRAAVASTSAISDLSELTEVPSSATVGLRYFGGSWPRRR
jgi:hypothetical protein